MGTKDHPLRVLWFSNTPGLGQAYLNKKVIGEGWITALQTEIEKLPEIELGYVFYSDDPIEPFTFNKTKYFPVQKINNTKTKRLLYRTIAKIEYEENIPNFLKIVDQFKPDLIHIQGTESPFGLIQKYISKIPIVVSIQGNLTAYTSRYFSGMKMPGRLAQWQSGYPYPSMDYALWLKRVKVEREILSHSRFILGRTHWDRRISRVLAPQARYVHIEELMRRKFYEAAWKQPFNPYPVFFTTSSGAFYKGLESLLSTARILNESNFSFRWKVAGLKESDSIVKLITRQTGIRDLGTIQVELLGKLSEDELIGEMGKADAYVQVSHIENSPNSVCEAMLLGMPVIATFAGGTSSLIENNFSGILVQDGDPFVMAGALMELTEKKQKAAKMGKQAREASHKRHNSQQILSTLLNVYTEIVRNYSTGLVTGGENS